MNSPRRLLQKADPEWQLDALLQCQPGRLFHLQEFARIVYFETADYRVARVSDKQIFLLSRQSTHSKKKKISAEISANIHIFILHDSISAGVFGKKLSSVPRAPSSQRLHVCCFPSAA